ncbi:hypothetical protein J6590_068196 [Homalodisca vitripennis]|nr:hypothetical protein J6590_068196 [Homalodisca vitripennis]
MVDGASETQLYAPPPHCCHVTGELRDKNPSLIHNMGVNGLTVNPKHQLLQNRIAASRAEPLLDVDWLGYLAITTAVSTKL